MKVRDLKYVLAFTGPLVAFFGLQWLGYWSWGVVLLEFAFIPIFEVLWKGSEANYGPEEESRLNSMRWFDFLLYINLPLLFILTYLYLDVISTQSLASYEWWGLTVGHGLIVGSIGINIAHEIGHRDDPLHQWMARFLLTPGLYTHFTIEHNLGHHKFVATRHDPSTARYGEVIYLFWLRSVYGVYKKAWQLELQRLNQQGKPLASLHNRMILSHLFVFLYLSAVYLLFGGNGLLGALFAGIIGFLLLESVNYIEHYGLQRKEYPNGAFERVDHRHSWNSNHDLGRIFLFELTRHSDHHFKASKKYQILKNYEESPQLPLGYPASILMALVPPLWFWKMNGKVREINSV